MSKKVDYKKDDKALYLPKDQPVILRVPPMRFAVIRGQGDPNGPEFALATEALYALSYAVKMSYKSPQVPKDYYEYTVYPLEGIWDLVDYAKGISDKSNLSYALMIRQPDFLDQALFESFIEATKKKKPNPYLAKMSLETIEDGLCCQMLHLGSYDDEPQSFQRMEDFAIKEGHQRASKTHREIYLSDPRKTAPEKLKTVLRFKV